MNARREMRRLFYPGRRREAGGPAFLQIDSRYPFARQTRTLKCERQNHGKFDHQKRPQPYQL